MHVHMVSGLHGYPVLLTFNNAHLTDRNIGFREIQNLDPGRITGSETLGRILPHDFSGLLSTEWLWPGSLSVHILMSAHYS